MGKKIIITNLPSFYKIRLFNEINKKIPLLVIFTGHSNEVRNADFYKGNIEFEHINLNKGYIANLYLIFKLISKRAFKELILSGWDSIYVWFALLLSIKKKNAIIVESSILESQVNGIKGLLKRMFLYKCVKAYVPGKSNADLIKKLGFNGEIIKTKGCGIFNYVPQPIYKPHNKVQRFIYVGRLAEEKNLKFLIKVFNTLPEYRLDIVGFGPQENELKSIAASNVIFHGAVDNKELPSCYGEADVFVLASCSETWGIVVEEALNNGLPVIVSDKVGCAEELVNNTNGIVFESDNEDSLRDAILKISEIEYYNKLRFNISQMDFDSIEKNQVDCFI